MRGLRARADDEVRRLIRSNATLRGARYGRLRRLLHSLILNRPGKALPIGYLLAMGAIVTFEWAKHRQGWCVALGFPGGDIAKDAAGFFLTAQIGILAVLTVSIGVVTLLVQNDDGSARNTDVRLYYAASYAHQLATSGVLLSVAIVVQLLWPLEPLVDWLGGPNAFDGYKVLVTILHAIWLVMNLALFLQFIETTLKFVEPRSRASLRKRYSASEIIPRDVFRRTFAALYTNLAADLLGPKVGQDEPIISFGMGLFADRPTTTEVSRHFPRPATLADIRVLPLHVAIRRWRRRTIANARSEGRARGRHRPGHLAILTSVGRVHRGAMELVVREGGAPLTAVERFLLRISFRFELDRPDLASTPSLTDFHEQLVSKVIGRIEASLPNGFADALSEVVDFHGFALEAQNTRGLDGVPFNLAQLSDGPFRRPDFEWIRAYHRAFEAAMRKLASSDVFVRTISRLPSRLWPDATATYPPEVLQNIIELGRHQIVVFEDWLTERAFVKASEGEAGAAPALAGSDQRAYEAILIDFVGAWETFQRIIALSFKLPHATRHDDEAVWATGTLIWSCLQSHLRNTAYFVAAAAWNEDHAGSDRFSDLLIRWTEAFHLDVQGLPPAPHALLITPGLLRRPWSTARSAIADALLFQREPPSAEQATGMIFVQAHRDALAMTAAVLLHWFAVGSRPSPALARTSLRLLKKEALPDSGNTLLEPSDARHVFRLVFDLLVRQALGSPFEEDTYSADLEAFIRTLDEMAAPRLIPGRIYGGFRLDGFQTLTPEFLTLMASDLPAEGDHGASEATRRLVEALPPADDRVLRNLEHQIGRYATALGTAADARFAAVTAAIGGDGAADDRRGRLKTILDHVVEVVARQRMKRLSEAAIDQCHLTSVRDAVGTAFLAEGRRWVPFFKGKATKTDTAVMPQEQRFGSIDRGSFTSPQMSAISLEDARSSIVEVAELNLVSVILGELYRRPKKIEALEAETGTRALLARVDELVAEGRSGDDQLLLVPREPFGTAIAMTASGFPTNDLEGCGLVRDHAPDIIHGFGYLGSKGSLRIYAWAFSDMALLCSGTVLTALSFGRVNGLDAIFDFELHDDGDPSVSMVHTSVAVAMEWEDSRIVELRLRNADDAEPADPTAACSP